MITYNKYVTSILDVKEEQEETNTNGLNNGEGVPVCGANMSSPVVDLAYYIDEIRYKIGGKVYVENAD